MKPMTLKTACLAACLAITNLWLAVAILWLPWSSTGGGVVPLRIWLILANLFEGFVIMVGLWKTPTSV